MSIRYTFSRTCKGENIMKDTKLPKKPTIADIANNCNSEYYWTLKTMRFFGQTRKSFSVFRTSEENVWGTSARGKFGTVSIHYWRKVVKFGFHYSFESLGNHYEPKT